MEATLLIYSGRANPKWPVDPAQARAIGAAIDALAEAPPGAVPPPGGLGYSGVMLDFADAAGARRRAVFAAGRASIDGKLFVDAGRRVERLILASGRDTIGSAADLF
ncbi:MAG: hypothetical protein V4574_12335 [Pseudomonadota bacterium]